MKKSKYSNLVNFGKNINLPRHSWFNIKEGYSSELVLEVFKDLSLNKNSIVFDPFSGSGTTVLTAIENGMKGVGFEVNPFLHFLSETKIFNTDNPLIDLMNKFKTSKGIKASKMPKLSISEKNFKSQLRTILKVKGFIDDLPESNEKKIFKSLFLSSLEDASYSKKDGNGLRYPKNKIPKNFITLLEQKIIKADADLLKKVKSSYGNIFYGNSLELIQSDKFIKKYGKKIDLCLFSPPYANCFDYTEVYKLELWFGDFIKEYKDLKILRDRTLSSHLNKSFLSNSVPNELKTHLKKIDINKLWSKKIHEMLISYFSEMRFLLENIHQILNKNGNCVIVVGNSAYSNIVIPTDLILEKMAKNIGYSNTKIVVARKLGTSSQQLKKVDRPELLRESLVVIKR